MNSISGLLKGAAISTALVVASVSGAVAADVDFSRYFKSSTALSAIASAVSILEPCDKPIKFKEKVEKEAITLTATCAGGDSESITVNLSFQVDESGNLFPDSFDYGN